MPRDIRRLIDTGKVLEGQARHASVHAAGVIVATRPLHEVVPLYRPAGTDDVVTQWDGPTCEKIGLLKMDFLGLRTLSVIERAKSLIRDTLPEDEIWKAMYHDRPDEMPDADIRARPTRSTSKRSPTTTRACTGCSSARTRRACSSSNPAACANCSRR
ncbi:hypothetical protein ABWH91_00060 [Phycisphaerales bacterium ac7]